MAIVLLIVAGTKGMCPQHFVKNIFTYNLFYFFVFQNVWKLSVPLLPPPPLTMEKRECDECDRTGMHIYRGRGSWKLISLLGGGGTRGTYLPKLFMYGIVYE